MNSKKDSLLMCIILLSGFLFPILAYSNTVIQGITPHFVENDVELATENTHFWYHDGSNITGFGSPVAGLSTMGSLTSSGTYFYATDLGSDSSWHGPGMSYTLEETFQVSQLTSFNVEIEFDCTQTTNRLGALNVILYDSGENPICRLIVSDAWADDRQMKLPFTWFYLNGSGYTTPYSEPSWVTFSPYYETISLTNTSSGFLVTIPDIGAFDIPVQSTTELDRVVTYVTIRFLQNEAWTYCEEVFIHSINLEWSEAIMSTSSTTPTETIPTSSTSPTPPPTGNPWGGLLLPISIGGGAVVIIVIVVILFSRRGSSGVVNPSEYDW